MVHKLELRNHGYRCSRKACGKLNKKKEEGFVGRRTSLVQNINGNDEKYAALGTIQVAGS
jgi:hypothetical protein